MKISVQITRQENANFFNKQINDIVQVEFEEYVAAVVASEIGNSTLEACKAQAIAARSFAISRSVFKDKAISDSSAVAQAYRASLYNKEKYPNAVAAAEATAGIVLCYNGKVASAIYGASNGGQTISAAQAWGGSGYPYLIQQNDPWDAAAGYKKNGHGVGMSQRGAMYAAKQLGKNYKEILTFYYPGTVLKGDYNMTKAEQVVTIAKSLIGKPYVFGALGPNSFDCRGYVWYCFNQVGITISTVGATTQWNTTSHWAERGTTDNLPNLVCALYKKDGNKMKHAGLHIGNGQIMHCTNANGSPGVTTDTIANKTWTHYAIPIGLYTPEEIKNAQKVNMMAFTTLKRGTTGGAVVELQNKLNSLGYNCGTADGNFGTQTEMAVRKFQAEYNLKVDGIAGSATLSKLEQVYGGDNTTPVTPSQNTADREKLLNLRKKLEEAINIINEMLL